MPRGAIVYGERAALNEEPPKRSPHDTLTAPERVTLPEERPGAIGGKNGARKVAFVFGWVPR